jgi:uncharacterized lipoprotein YbaY
MEHTPIRTIIAIPMGVLCMATVMGAAPSQAQVRDKGRINMSSSGTGHLNVGVAPGKPVTELEAHPENGNRATLKVRVAGQPALVSLTGRWGWSKGRESMVIAVTRGFGDAAVAGRGVLKMRPGGFFVDSVTLSGTTSRQPFLLTFKSNAFRPEEIWTKAVTGMVVSSDTTALPQNATVQVKLLEGTEYGAPVVSSAAVGGKTKLPIPFTLRYAPSFTKPDKVYEIQAVVTVQGETRFATEIAPLVITGGSPTQNVRVVVRPTRRGQRAAPPGAAGSLQPAIAGSPRS